eukprot:805972-Pyramimonas_sp.AAC.1
MASSGNGSGRTLLPGLPCQIEVSLCVATLVRPCVPIISAGLSGHVGPRGRLGGQDLGQAGEG